MNSLSKENRILTAQYAEEKSKKEALERSFLEERNRKSGKGLIVAVIILAILLIISLILRYLCLLILLALGQLSTMKTGIPCFYTGNPK